MTAKTLATISVSRLAQKSYAYNSHSFKASGHKRDIQQEKENVRVAHFLHHRPCVSRPVPEFPTGTNVERVTDGGTSVSWLPGKQ